MKFIIRRILSEELIKESQYNTLFRRYVTWAPLDELVDLFISFLGPRNYETFDLFYTKIKEHTTDRIIRDMLTKDMLDTTDYVNNESKDLVEKIKNNVHSYIDNNLKDKVEDIYKRHSKKKSKTLKESIRRILSEETENNKLPYFFTRRIDHHKFEKMMRKGIPYMYYDSNSLEEFKYKLVEATLENYVFKKYDIEIEKELPKEDIDTFVKHMISVYDSVLTMYYKTMKRKWTYKKTYQGLDKWWV